jgi:hypothetical protein
MEKLFEVEHATDHFAGGGDCGAVFGTLIWAI